MDRHGRPRVALGRGRPPDRTGGGLLRSDPLFDDELYEALRRYLDPGEHHPDEGTTIVYTESQKPVVESVAGHRRKVRGVAGCGKTRCLAGRAVAARQRHGRPVLLLTYNLALRNYIHDRVSDVREPFPWSAFHITNYHQFFKAQALYHNLPHHTLADAGRPGFFESVRDETRRYATILIDEVQDYESEWIQSLSDYFLDEEDGELVVFGDEKQNVYGRELDEEKLPHVPTVPGRWRTLTESHRLGPGSLRLAQAFQAAFFDGDYEPVAEVEQADLFAEAGVVRYHHRPGLGDDDLFALVQGELLSLGVHPNQVAVLAPTIETLRTLDLRFRSVAHERTARTFETQEEHDRLVDLYGGPDVATSRQKFHWDLKKLRRTRKLHFWPNPGTVKLSTVLSFKGWEAHTLVLVLREADLRREDSEMDETVYAALTRATTNAVVVATDGDRYRDFFAPHAVPDGPSRLTHDRPHRTRLRPRPIGLHGVDPRRRHRRLQRVPRRPEGDPRRGPPLARPLRPRVRTSPLTASPSPTPSRSRARRTFPAARRRSSTPSAARSTASAPGWRRRPRTSGPARPSSASSPTATRTPRPTTPATGSARW